MHDSVLDVALVAITVDLIAHNGRPVLFILVCLGFQETVAVKYVLLVLLDVTESIDDIDLLQVFLRVFLNLRWRSIFNLVSGRITHLSGRDTELL